MSSPFAKSGKRNAHLIEKLFSQADWVFASPDMAGKQPYWPENLLRRHIQLDSLVQQEKTFINT
jgi:hypothetical protein